MTSFPTTLPSWVPRGQTRVYFGNPWSISKVGNHCGSVSRKGRGPWVFSGDRRRRRRSGVGERGTLPRCHLRKVRRGTKVSYPWVPELDLLGISVVFFGRWKAKGMDPFQTWVLFGSTPLGERVIPSYSLVVDTPVLSSCSQIVCLPPHSPLFPESGVRLLFPTMTGKGSVLTRGVSGGVCVWCVCFIV